MVKIGFCGDNCSKCPRYIATIDNDIEKLKEAALMWERVGWRNRVLSPEEIKCGGCKTVTWCRYNEIRKCAIKKQIDNCGECNEYSCRKLNVVFKKTVKYMEECRVLFSKRDFHVLSKAFFTKKENLDQIHSKLNSQT